MSVESVEVIVSGRVQGVGYREFARSAALTHGVAGHVRNRSNGTVEARLVGETAALEAVLAELRRGPGHGWVRELTIAARGQAEPESGFRVEATR